MGSKSRYFLILKIVTLLTLCVCITGSLQGVKNVVISLVVDTAFFCDVTPNSPLEADCREFTYFPIRASYIYLFYLTCIVVMLCYLLYYVCIAVFTLDAGLLATSQYSEGPATGHLGTSFSWFPCA